MLRNWCVSNAAGSGGGVPANAILDRAGNAIVDRNGDYIVSR